MVGKKGEGGGAEGEGDEVLGLEGEGEGEGEEEEWVAHFLKVLCCLRVEGQLWDLV